MIDIVKAIKTRWTAKGLGSSVTGGIHHGRVAEKPTYPYCVFRELDSPVVNKSRCLRFSEFQVQFDIYDRRGDATLAADLAVLVRDAFVNSERAASNPLSTGTTTNIMDADVTRNVTTVDDGEEQVFRSSFEMAIRFNEPRNLNPS